MAATDPFALDPFSTVARLGLLCFMDPQTKIGICENSLMFFDPSLISWMWRNYWNLVKQGCSRHDLFHLRLPLTRAVAWYKDTAPEVLDYAQRGLEQLSELYVVHGNVRETINSMVRLLSERDGVEAEDMSNKPNLRRLHEAWTLQEIEAVAHLFTLLKQEHSHYIVSAIHRFIEGKEPMLLDIIREHNM
jgi:hypothetical protein